MDPFGSHDVFFHVRILIGVFLGLGLTRILSGIARWVQHPGKQRLYPVHLVWVAIILLSAIHFWWFEFGQVWRFGNSPDRMARPERISESPATLATI